MKKLLFSTLLVLAAGSTFAQHHSNHGNYNSYGRSNWVAPLIISGAITYALTRPVVISQPVVVVPQYITPQQTTNTMYINGVVYHQELIAVNGIYQQVWVSR